MILLLLSTLTLLACVGCAQDGTAGSPEQPGETAAAGPPTSFDLDITSMPENLWYAQACHVFDDAEDYLGKTIKVRGYFYIYEADIRNVYACIVMDPTECCAQGFEFRLAGDPKFPDDYPPADAEITVVGTLGTYSDDEGEHFAYELQNAYILPS